MATGLVIGVAASAPAAVRKLATVYPWLAGVYATETLVSCRVESGARFTP